MRATHASCIRTSTRPLTATRSRSLHHSVSSQSSLSLSLSSLPSSSPASVSSSFSPMSLSSFSPSSSLSLSVDSLSLPRSNYQHDHHHDGIAIDTRHTDNKSNHNHDDSLVGSSAVVIDIPPVSSATSSHALPPSSSPSSSSIEVSIPPAMAAVGERSRAELLAAGQARLAAFRKQKYGHDVSTPSHGAPPAGAPPPSSASSSPATPNIALSTPLRSSHAPAVSSSSLSSLSPVTPVKPSIIMNGNSSGHHHHNGTIHNHHNGVSHPPVLPSPSSSVLPPAASSSSSSNHHSVSMNGHSNDHNHHNHGHITPTIDSVPVTTQPSNVPTPSSSSSSRPEPATVLPTTIVTPTASIPPPVTATTHHHHDEPQSLHGHMNGSNNHSHSAIPHVEPTPLHGMNGNSNGNGDHIAASESPMPMPSIVVPTHVVSSEPPASIDGRPLPNVSQATTSDAVREVVPSTDGHGHGHTDGHHMNESAVSEASQQAAPAEAFVVPAADLANMQNAMLERDELRRIAQQQQEKMDELLHEREHVQSLANAVNELRAENKRLLGVNGSLQDNLKAQRSKAEELHEDNSRMTDELDRAEDELTKLQQRLQEREKELKKLAAANHGHGHGHGHALPSPAFSSSAVPSSSPHPTVCGHSALFSQLQLHVQRVDAVIQQSVALSKRIQSQAQPIVSTDPSLPPSASSSADDSMSAVEIAPSVDTAEVVHLCAEQSPLLSQAIGELAVIRELVDPVAVVLATSPSPSLLPSSAAAAAAGAPSPRRNRYGDDHDTSFADDDVKRERDEYKHQLDMQQERASILISDKVALARKIEQVLEEKQTLMSSLRGTVDSVTKDHAALQMQMRTLRKERDELAAANAARLNEMEQLRSRLRQVDPAPVPMTSPWPAPPSVLPPPLSADSSAHSLPATIPAATLTAVDDHHRATEVISSSSPSPTPSIADASLTQVADVVSLPTASSIPLPSSPASSSVVVDIQTNGHSHGGAPTSVTLTVQPLAAPKPTATRAPSTNGKSAPSSSSSSSSKGVGNGNGDGGNRGFFGRIFAFFLPRFFTPAPPSSLNNNSANSSNSNNGNSSGGVAVAVVADDLKENVLIL